MHMNAKQALSIARRQQSILSERAKHRPMDKHVEKYIAQLHNVIKSQDERICELLAENARLTLEKASFEMERKSNEQEQQ